MSVNIIAKKLKINCDGYPKSDSYKNQNIRGVIKFKRLVAANLNNLLVEKVLIKI